MIEKTLDTMDEMAYMIEQLERNPEAVLRAMEQRNGVGTSLLGAKVERVLAAEAVRGARTLKIFPQGGGPSLIHIDDRPAFYLAPRLAKLLEFLALKTPYSQDGMVGWKTKEAAAEYLNQFEDHQTKATSLDTLIWRLRQELRVRAHLHRNFIESKSGLGIRFRLQQPY
jgi:hypothetical protein